MLGVAAMWWALRKARNKTCFEKKVINNLDEIVYSACALMRYWAGLYPESTQRAIGEVVDLMIRMAIQLLGKQNKKRRLMLTDGRCSSEDSDDREGSDAA
jgi:hypothetical protein